MLILLNIIFLFKFPLIFTSNLECKQINNCYECLNNPQCFMFNNNCDNENKPLKKENWYNNFEEYCIIENNENQKYCGLIEKSNKRVKIVKNNFFSKHNLFCKYNFNSDNLNDKTIKIISNVYSSNINLSIEVQIDDNNKMIYNITEKNSISEKIKKFKLISIYYYHNNIPEKDDFYLEIKIKNKITYSDVVIYIFVFFGIIVIFLAIFLFVYIIKILSQKKKNNKKVDIISNDSINNNNENICNNICNQTNKIKKHFILKRIKYNKTYILYNQKCPICIEEIKINDDVIILTCNHGFHMFCITEWIKKNIKKNRYCPICHLKFNQTKQNQNKIEEIKKENIIDNNKIINQEINENNNEYNIISPNSENSKNSNIIINSNNNDLNK